MRGTVPHNRKVGNAMDRQVRREPTYLLVTVKAVLMVAGVATFILIMAGF